MTYRTYRRLLWGWLALGAVLGVGGLALMVFAVLTNQEPLFYSSLCLHWPGAWVCLTMGRFQEWLRPRVLICRVCLVPSVLALCTECYMVTFREHPEEAEAWLALQ